MAIKLVLVITGLSGGGAETMLYKLLQHIDRSRFDPTVISLTTKGDIGPNIEALGIPVHSLEMRPRLPSPLRFIHLVQLMRRLKPEVVHTWMYHADLLGGLAARLAGIRSIAWGIRHSNLMPAQNKGTTLMTMRFCAWVSTWLPQYILSCSERATLVHVAAGYCANKFVLIPNGFNLERFSPDFAARVCVRNELGLASNTLLVGLVGRYDLQKNHLGFVDAAKRVNQAMPSVHFVMAGTEVDWGNHTLVQAIEKAGLRHHFHLLGRLGDISRLMASLDILASSSFGEAFPNVLGEAMSCGVPCVVTDVGDSADIIGDTGRAVASGDMNGLAQHIIELLRWPSGQRIQLGIKARQRVRDNYEIGDIAQRYGDFYVQMKGYC